MKPGEAYWSVVSSVWDAISIYDGPLRFEQEFAAAPVVARTLFAAHWCQTEVCNGGLHQFFSNSTGVLAPEAAIAFRTIGMPQQAEVIDQAMAWFGDFYPREKETNSLMPWTKYSIVSFALKMVGLNKLRTSMQLGNAIRLNRKPFVFLAFFCGQ